MADALKWHPDIEFVHDVIDGIELGRATGFRGDRFLQRDCTNPPAHQVHYAARDQGDRAA